MNPPMVYALTSPSTNKTNKTTAMAEISLGKWA